MPGRKSRDKGLRFERELVNLFQQEGLAAERIPLSGSAGGSFCGDLTLPVMGRDRRFEAKKRARGFQLLYEYLGDHYGLIVAQDRATPLVVLRIDQFIQLILPRYSTEHEHTQAIKSIREKRIRLGEIQPSTEQERRWAEEGQCDSSQYETARNG